MSTSWTCTGDPPVGDATNYDCRPAFDLFSYRRVREVKIGEGGGTQACETACLHRVPSFRYHILSSTPQSHLFPTTASVGVGSNCSHRGLFAPPLH